LKLTYVALIGAGDRWRGIRITAFEQRQLKVIRDKLDRAHTSPPVYPARTGRD
jgi:hypothetical protein